MFYHQNLHKLSAKKSSTGQQDNQDRQQMDDLYNRADYCLLAALLSICPPTRLLKLSREGDQCNWAAGQPGWATVELLMELSVELPGCSVF